MTLVAGLAGGRAVLKMRGSFRNGVLFGGGFAINELFDDSIPLSEVLILQRGR